MPVGADQGADVRAGSIGNKNNHRHGHATGGSFSPTYLVWAGVRRRCAGKAGASNKYYGARGIKVCERWESFPNFLADMGEIPEGHSIDRINPDGDYEPGNCRWIPLKAQARNRRSTRIINFAGQSRCLAEWAELTGVRVTTIIERLKRGWPVERALTEKPR